MRKTQPTSQPEIYIPKSARREPDFDFDEERVPVHQQLGNLSDRVFNFIFSPNTIKFGILLFYSAPSASPSTFQATTTCSAKCWVLA